MGSPWDPAARILLGWFGKNPPYSWCLLFIILRPQATAAPCSLAIKPQLSFLFSELSLTSRPCCDCLGTSFNSPEYTWQNNFKKIIHTIFLDQSALRSEGQGDIKQFISSSGFFFFFFALTCGMCELNSLTRDQVLTSCTGSSES